MGFSPVARVATPKVALLRKYINAYRGITHNIIWSVASDILDSKIGGYSRSHMQNTNQLGIEYRQNNNSNNFEIQSYLLCFNDDMLLKYLKFWSMVYYAPNLRITHAGTDEPLIIFTKLAREVINSPTNEIDFTIFCNDYCSGGSIDIMQSILRDNALYITLSGNIFSVETQNIENLTALVDFIDTNFPIPTEHLDRKIFFDRFSCQNFKLFYSHFGEIFTEECIKMQHNKILYGAPGTGKSYKLKTDVNCYFNPSNVERINFYNGYSYGQFVGTYKPIPVYKETNFKYKEFGSFIRTIDSEPYVIYEYIPGFFLQMIIKALKDRNNIYCLIIEEINRSKVDAVFGDMFQLLDRDDIGKSEYRVKCSEEMLDFVKTVGLDTSTEEDIINNGIYIPENLYLWATMNSADQGVFPMDTAFKRRWNFDYIGLNDNAEEMNTYKIQTNNTTTTDDSWNKFRDVINEILSTNYDIAEDKLLAPFFVNQKDFNETSRILETDIFINKVIMYIKEDVLRHRKETDIFIDNRFSDIASKYKNNEEIFTLAFIEALNT